MMISIRRQWKDRNDAKIYIDKIERMHWDFLSGGIGTRFPQPLVMGYVWCDDVKGDIAHICTMDTGPHYIKVFIIRKQQSQEAWIEILRRIGSKPMFR